MNIFNHIKKIYIYFSYESGQSDAFPNFFMLLSRNVIKIFSFEDVGMLIIVIRVLESQQHFVCQNVLAQNIFH